MAVATGLIMVLMAWLFSNFEQRVAKSDAAATPATRLEAIKPDHPPGPVLQGAPGSRFELLDPVVEMEAWDAQMDDVLATSGWMDRNNGTVRIPIEEAKKLLLQRGLTVRAQGEVAAGGSR